MRRRITSLGMDTFLSPFDTMFNFIPQGHEKALKHALYNALAIFLMMICVSGVIAVFYILEPFIKPLLWALLCGSVLYPLKQTLADILKRWLEELDHSSTPLVFGMILVPIQVVDAMSEWALCAALYRWKLLLGLFSSFILLCVSYYFTPGIILCFVRASFVTVLLIADTVVNFLSTPLVTASIIAHVIAVALWWYKPTIPPSTEDVLLESNEEILHRRLRSFLRLSATLVWLLTGGYLVGGGLLLKSEEYKALRTPAFLLFLTLLIIGLVSEFWEKHAKNKTDTKPGESFGVDFSKWSVFLKGGTEEQGESKGKEVEEEKQELLLRSTESESDLATKKNETVIEKEQKAKSNVSGATPSVKEPESGQNQEETPKSSKKICFCCEKMDSGKIDTEKIDTEKIDTEKLDTEKTEEDSSVFKDRPTMLKVPSQLERKTSNPSITSLAEVMIKEDAIKNPLLFAKSRTGSKCFVIPLQSQTDFTERKLSMSEEEEEANIISSYNCICGVMWACIIVLLVKNPWILQLLFLPLILCLLHRTCRFFEVWSKLWNYVKPLTDIIYDWYEPRQDAIFPTATKGLYKLMAKLNRQLTHILLGGVDGAASFVVMVGIIMFVVTSFLFLIVQSYGEAFHMVQVCGNVINSTIVNNPELSAYLPEGMESMLDNTLNNAYVYGREGLVSLIRSLLGSDESEAREKLESQVLELWDRVYQAWVMGSNSNTANGPHVTDEAVLSSWDNLLDTVKKTPALTNLNAWSQFAQENLETVTSLLTSVWMLLKGNITLVITIVTTLLSVVFGGGSALFGFFISTIVFLTALFYLLNSSGQQYKPVEMISILSPSNGQRKGVDYLGIGKAFEAAINGVFEASFKMAVFYGMWTWFIHNIFQMQIVYIPTALAALLAAIPVLGVYWASLPAVIDLWLAQGKSLQALLLFLAILLPTSVVDTTIYKEIKSSGHPYLTALSIAGGVFCLGMEGAIMGPMILCCFLVIVNLSSNLIKDSTSETVVPVHLRRMRRMDTVM